jgi:hypothetical protein
MMFEVAIAVIVKFVLITKSGVSVLDQRVKKCATGLAVLTFPSASLLSTSVAILRCSSSNVVLGVFLIDVTDCSTDVLRVSNEE